MPLRSAWRNLGRTLFPEIPEDCGNPATPGFLDHPDFRDWSARPTTQDQQRIERYVDRFDLHLKRVLHIGIGNSGLARRFNRRVKEIVGTSIDQPEIATGRALALPNYELVLHNKYSGDDGAIDGRFDFIIDNNPTSSCCCIAHLTALFDFYAAKLADGGQIVTDRQGLGWIAPGGHPRFRFGFDDLASVARLVGLSTWNIDGNVYVLARQAPAKPMLRPLFKSALRRLIALSRRAIQIGPRAVFRRLCSMVRKSRT